MAVLLTITQINLFVYAEATAFQYGLADLIL